jgi:hypothetical protein
MPPDDCVKRPDTPNLTSVLWKMQLSFSRFLLYFFPFSKNNFGFRLYIPESKTASSQKISLSWEEVLRETIRTRTGTSTAPPALTLDDLREVLG